MQIEIRGASNNNEEKKNKMEMHKQEWWMRMMKMQTSYNNDVKEIHKWQCYKKRQHPPR
jgi:hypothetical protein